MPEKNLTDRELQTARRSTTEKEYLLNDGGGLYARVRPSQASDDNAMAWLYVFRQGGRLYRHHLGAYPKTSLKRARELHEQARAIVNAGGNPIEARRAEEQERAARAAAALDSAQALSRRMSVEALFAVWREQYLAHERKDGGAGLALMFQTHVLPRLGRRPAEEIQPADVADVIEAIVRDGKRRTANMVMAALKQMFQYALVKGRVRANPAGLFTKKHAGGTEAPRTRFLSAEEIAELENRFPESGLEEPQRAALRLLLATGARMGELVHARWEHLDLAHGTWTIPAEHSKNGQQHLVHLSGFALAQVATLKAFARGPYLLTSSRSEGGAIDVKSLTKAVHDRQRTAALKNRTRRVQSLCLPGGPWTPHDLRRTMVTHMNALGVPYFVVEKCVNHRMDGMLAVYNQHDYLEERRRAYELWGARLAELMQPQSRAAVPAIATLGG